jgi:hypothetical protein
MLTTDGEILLNNFFGDTTIFSERPLSYDTNTNKHLFYLSKYKNYIFEEENGLIG